MALHFSRMTEIGKSLVVHLDGDTDEEICESLKENRKKICKLLAQAHDENNMGKCAQLISVLTFIEPIAEGEKEKKGSSIEEERKKLSKAIVETYKRKDRKLMEHLCNLSKLERLAAGAEAIGQGDAEVISTPFFYALNFKK